MNCLSGPLKVLVICPSSIKTNWARELAKWSVVKRPIFVADSKLLPDMVGVVIVNFDVLHKHEEVIHRVVYDLLIVDECHFLKAGQKSRRGKMVFGVKPTKRQQAAGIGPVPGIQAKRKIFLTGTPICNRPAELFPLINYLDPIRWDNFFKFGLRYCAGTQGGHGWDFTGASNLDELQDTLRSSGLMIRRLKKDVLKDLPPIRRQIVEFDAEGEARDLVKAERRALDQREDEMADLHAEVEIAKASDNEEDYRAAVNKLQKGMGAIFSEMAKLRHDTAVAKIPQVIEHLREVLEEVECAVVLCHHHDVSDALMKEFGELAVLHRGDMNLDQKDAAVRRFQGMAGEPHDPTCRLFIGSIQASGVGITLTRAALLVFTEGDWVPGNMAQGEARIHRIGQAESVLIQHLVLEGSLDAIMAKRIIAKQEVIERALDVEPTAREKEIAATAGLKREKIEAEAVTITPEQKRAAHDAMRFLSARCNGARDWDGAGFSKIDTCIGKSFAAQEYLTNKQAVIALRIARKYRGQLGEHLIVTGTLDAVQARNCVEKQEVIDKALDACSTAQNAEAVMGRGP